MQPSMPASPIPIVQNCYVVPNLEAACRAFHDQYGIGPFVGGATVMLTDHIYRGTPQPPIELIGCFVQSGDLNIELVELVSEGPSAFRDMFPGKAGGFHHTALFADDYEAARDMFVARGYPVVSEFRTVWGAPICYVDARADLGHMIEVYPEDETIRSMYAQARNRAENWDGRDLIVPWDIAARELQP